VNPIVSVITTIGLDHTEYLGSSLEEIAYEKAGIVREGESVVVGVEEKEGMEALVRICEQKKACVTQVGKDLNWELKEASIKGQKFDIKGKDLEHKDLFIRLLGRHQLVNATCGVGAIQLLHERGFRIRSEDIKSGLRVAFIRGRLEVVGKNPLVVLDVAHNPQGAATIRGNLSTFKFKRLILILGILKDKDIHGIVKELAPLASVIIATRPKSDRACEPDEIIREALKYNEKTIVIEEVENALKFAEDEATQRDLILVTGSNYTVGEALIYFG
jgi:dihydrofolate synthase/folylpolyglutamate synthase